MQSSRGSLRRFDPPPIMPISHLIAMLALPPLCPSLALALALLPSLPACLILSDHPSLPACLLPSLSFTCTFQNIFSLSIIHKNNPTFMTAWASLPVYLSTTHSRLIAITPTSHRYHAHAPSPSHPRPIAITRLPHHAPSRACPITITRMPHHAPSRACPITITRLPHHHHARVCRGW